LRLQPRDHALENGAAAMVRIGLSPPPIPPRQPPASNIAGVAGVSVVTFGTLALVTRRFLFDEGEILS